jgi:hypothetical protein
MRRFHGVATKNLPSYLSWRRTIEALSTDSDPDAWIMGAAGLVIHPLRSAGITPLRHYYGAVRA